MAQEISSVEQLPSWSKCAASVRACCKCVLDYGMSALQFIIKLFNAFLILLVLVLILLMFISAIFVQIVTLVLWYQEAMPVPLDPRAIAFVIVSSVMLLLLLMVQDLKMTAMLGNLCLLLNAVRFLKVLSAVPRWLPFESLPQSQEDVDFFFYELFLWLWIVSMALILISMALILGGFGMVLGIFGMVLNLLPFLSKPVCWYSQQEFGKIISTTPLTVALIFFTAALNSRLNSGSSLLDWWPTCATWACLCLYMGLVFPWPFQHLPWEDSYIAWTSYPYEISLCVFLGACASSACILMCFCSILHKGIQSCSLSYEKFSMDLLSLIVQGGCAVLTMALIIKYEVSPVWASLLLSLVGLQTLLRLLTLLKRNPRRRRAAAEPSSCRNPRRTATIYGAYEPEQEQDPTVFAPGDGQQVRNWMTLNPLSEWVPYWLDDFPQYPSDRKAIDWAKLIFPAFFFLDDQYLCESPDGAPAPSKCLYGKREHHELVMRTWFLKRPSFTKSFKKFGKKPRIRPQTSLPEVDLSTGGGAAVEPAEKLKIYVRWWECTINTFIHFKMIDMEARCSETPPGF